MKLLTVQDIIDIEAIEPEAMQGVEAVARCTEKTREAVLAMPAAEYRGVLEQVMQANGLS
jgi:hypothetical protein